MDQHNHAEDPGEPGSWYKTRSGLALIGFASVGLLLLVYEHRLHIPFGNLLVIVPLFACIGLHSLMHGGHGGHGGHSGHDRRSNDATDPTTSKPAEDSEAGQR